MIGMKKRMYEKSVAYYLFSILENLDRIDLIYLNTKNVLKSILTQIRKEF